MKKKITAITLCVALLAVAIVGGTLAYFTDTDEATNTFTVGNVKIDLEEVFDPDNATLMPGPENSVNKDVYIQNTGANDAYVWYEWLIPAALDSTDGSTGTNNIVHVNSPGSTWDIYRENSKYWTEGQTEALPLESTWDHSSQGTQGFIGTETIDGVVYNKYVSLYHGVLAPNDKTTKGMDKVYLDKNVDFDGTNYTINGEVIDYDFDGNVNIIVRAYGIQAEGFEDVYAAYAAYQAQAN